MHATLKKYEFVREAILSLYARKPPGFLLPPEQDLAQQFGVSRITVARALTDLKRAGIVERKQRRGTYLAEKRSKQGVIGILLAREQEGVFGSDFYGPLLVRSQEEFLASDYAVLVFGAKSACGRHVLTPNEAAQKPVDGLLIVGIMNAEYHAELTRLRIPVVGIEFHFEEDASADYVVEDCEASAFEATRRLLSQGHRRIAYFGHATRSLNPISCPDQNALERLAGVRRAFLSAGISPPEDLFFQAPLPRWNNLQDLVSHLFSVSQPPTACFCEWGACADAVAAFLRTQGKPVKEFPDFVLLGGYPAPMPEIQGWRIRTDVLEMGRTAANRMLERLAKPSMPFETKRMPWTLEPLSAEGGSGL